MSKNMEVISLNGKQLNLYY